jgi:hypothetical protein
MKYADKYLKTVINGNREVEMIFIEADKRINRLENMILSIKKSWYDFSKDKPKSDGWYIVSKGGNHSCLAFYSVKNDKWLGESNHHIQCWIETPILPWDSNFNIHDTCNPWNKTTLPKPPEGKS